ncbi:MAG: FAD-dependent oxidoreductase [Verrucomicrobia bacterium]|nr:FAD-dependent oxidoreductase [Kiritimatiellia bacterium]MCO6400885.1 FAD-dependent oxidoreductase [Verrucomicrobiota bacterium]
MSDRMFPLQLDRTARWIRDELRANDSIYGISRDLFFVPSEGDPFRTSVFEQALGTPIGVAAGPHTQMTQNILAAWLCGARFIELKTVQTLDELTVSKPCIDMEDAGYNVEWSQELRIHESIQEYVNAWMLIHYLHRLLGFKGRGPGTVFNMSVGYNMEGILKPNVQGFLDAMANASAPIARGREMLTSIFPDLGDVEVPKRISDNVTLSTMHGCPPGEIGAISRYLLEERKLHTYVKLNPTLLGPKHLRSILNDQLGFEDIEVPDAAFEHDITFDSAVALIRELRAVAANQGLSFGIKLSNTLEVINHRAVFDGREKQMYMSGRPLHAVTIHAVQRLQEVFDGELNISFAGGADAFNIAELMACGMKTVTVCSDVLRSGGYGRLPQYLAHLREAMQAAGASNLDDFVRAKGGEEDRIAAAQRNVTRYAAETLAQPFYREATYDRADTKSQRPLGLFDCIKAPCTEVCPIEQGVPEYMRAVAAGQFEEAALIVGRDNTMPSVLGRACHHPCQMRCVRTHLDEPLAIREIKRFILDQARASWVTGPKRGQSVAIIGAGPCGLATADFLSRAGYRVTLFDAHDREGGMVALSIPGYRSSDNALTRDLSFLRERGVNVRYGQRAGVDFQLDDLRREGFRAIVVAIGAQRAGKLGVEGEDVAGVWDSLSFLREAREGRHPKIGRRVGVVGGGDVAMDCARTAWRLGADEVCVIYRRTRKEMPAQRDELQGLLDENIPIHELLAPERVLSEGGALTGLVCSVMELGDPDASGRRRPQPIPGKVETLPLDTLIVAISQAGDFAWLEKAGVRLNRQRFVDVNPTTLETAVPGVYAGGDAIGSGPATIVKALGDGKRIARAIREHFEGPLRTRQAAAQERVDRALLQKHRATRAHAAVPTERELTQRRNFEEVMFTLDTETAKKEAARCLDCDKLCSYCVGVCPNLALFTYEHTPLERALPVGRIADGVWHATGSEKISISQRYQVAVFADLCNECGNCVTFCPSAGRPYRDKPRIYSRRDEWQRESDNAFLLQKRHDGCVIEARIAGTTHRLEMNGTLIYSSPMVRAEWSRHWDLISVVAAAEAVSAERVSLRPALEMAALLLGMIESVPYIPLWETA